MARYKPVDRSPKFIPVVLDAQIQHCSFEYALDYLVDNELDLSALHARYHNDLTGAPAYDPAVLLKIVLLACSRGLISSRGIERACRENVLFMALSGDSVPQLTTVAKFIRELAPQIQTLFTQVLLTCDAQGLIGKHMFAIDGVKLSSNASKECSGSFAELAHEADLMERGVKKMIATHQSRDAAASDTHDEPLNTQRKQRLRQEAARIRDFLGRNTERKSAKGTIRKSNVTDNDSAKMATAKGVIQGYTAVAAVDSAHQVIVAATAHGSGLEHSTLLPTVEMTDGVRNASTLITADAGYHSEANLNGVGHGGARVCQSAAQQAAGSLYAAQPAQGKRPVDAVLPGAQHREARKAWVCPVKAKGQCLQRPPTADQSPLRQKIRHTLRMYAEKSTLIPSGFTAPLGAFGKRVFIQPR